MTKCLDRGARTSRGTRRGPLPTRRTQLTNSLVNNFAKADDKTKKDLVKASKNMQGKNSPMLRLMQAQQGGRTSDAGSKSGGGATAPAAASAHQSSSGNDQVNSFTIALLLHRSVAALEPRNPQVSCGLPLTRMLSRRVLACRQVEERVHAPGARMPAQALRPAQGAHELWLHTAL